jgi:hypothetical protein
VEVLVFELFGVIGDGIDDRDDFAAVDLLELLRVPVGHVAAADEGEVDHRGSLPGNAAC